MSIKKTGLVEQLQLASEAKDDIVNEKTDEAEQYKLKCETMAGMVQQKLIEVEQLTQQLKAKDDIIGQKTAKVEQYVLKCKFLAESLESKMAEVSRLQLKLDTEDEIVNRKSVERCDTKLTNYRCSKCSKYFIKKSSLDYHLTQTACADEKKLDWQCEICEQMFTYFGLTRHLNQLPANTIQEVNTQNSVQNTIKLF